MARVAGNIAEMTGVRLCLDMADREPPSRTGDAASDRDAGLMVRVAAGDMEAFECLVEAHQNRVYGTIARMLGDADEAEDLAQEVFVRVWRSAGRYKPSAKFTTWLMTITRNLVFNECRRRRRKPSESMEPATPDESPRQFADTAGRDPAGAALDAELERVVRGAIGALPEQQRLAVVLRRYEELPYEEIARVLKTTVPSVKSLLFRARAELKRRLADYL